MSEHEMEQKSSAIKKQMSESNVTQEESEKYCCEYCESKMEWEKTYSGLGVIWICEKCNKFFCSECARKIFGTESYKAYVTDGDSTLCPECAEKNEEDSHAG